MHDQILEKFIIILLCFLLNWVCMFYWGSVPPQDTFTDLRLCHHIYNYYSAIQSNYNCFHRCVLETIRLRAPGMITRKVMESHTINVRTLLWHIIVCMMAHCLSLIYTITWKSLNFKMSV